MAATKIQWADYTFNPWRGCEKISPGCTHCYAEAMSARNPKVLGEWGPDGKRVIAAESYWRMPLRWDRQAKEAGERRRVFCGSLCDVFEARPELTEPRQRLFQLIGRTPNLNWLLLTKRPEVAVENWVLWAGFWASGQSLETIQAVAKDYVIPNVWAGVSIEDQPRADERIPHLQRIPAAVRFLSLEPLLGPVNLHLGQRDDGYAWERHLEIGWVIVGGESGPHARPCDIDCIRYVVTQCRKAPVPVFVKQLGAHPCEANRFTGQSFHHVHHVDGAELLCKKLRDSKGGDPSEWPEDLRVREFPR